MVLANHKLVYSDILLTALASSISSYSIISQQASHFSITYKHIPTPYIIIYQMCSSCSFWIIYRITFHGLFIKISLQTRLISSATVYIRCKAFTVHTKVKVKAYLLTDTSHMLYEVKWTYISSQTHVVWGKVNVKLYLLTDTCHVLLYEVNIRWLVRKSPTHKY